MKYEIKLDSDILYSYYLTRKSNLCLKKEKSLQELLIILIEFSINLFKVSPKIQNGLILITGFYQ